MSQLDAGLGEPAAPDVDACAQPVTGGGLLSADDARRQILGRVAAVAGRESVSLRDAVGRVLAVQVYSAIDVPPTDNSAMDGYALRNADLSMTSSSRLTLVGTALAGVPFNGHVQSGECVRVTTGAVLPQGTDTVVMQEEARVDDGVVTVGIGHCGGDNVRHAGDDVAAGQSVLLPGIRLAPAQLGLLASIGRSQIEVFRRIRVAFFSTGDELRGAGDALRNGEIHDSNRYSLNGMLQRLGADITDLGVVRDSRDDVRAALINAAEVADAVITSGGASVGEADFIPGMLAELGDVHFWRIAMKPGKPLAVGQLGSAAFFGLPGNPVSTMVAFYQFVQPALRKMAGETLQDPLRLRVPAATDLPKAPGRLEYQRGILQTTKDGELQVASTGLQDSHLLTSMSLANCFIVLPEDCAGVRAGERVEVQLFSSLV